MNFTDDEIKGKVLHKLTRAGKFKHSHTAIENLQKGFPPELRGKVKDIIKELKKEQILISKPTSYGEHISINLNMNEKVIYYITKFLDKK